MNDFVENIYLIVTVIDSIGVATVTYGIVSNLICSFVCFSSKILRGHPTFVFYGTMTLFDIFPSFFLSYEGLLYDVFKISSWRNSLAYLKISIIYYIFNMGYNIFSRSKQFFNINKFEMVKILVQIYSITVYFNYR